MPKAMPLPPDYFVPPELSEREKQWLIKHARESARFLVESVRGGSHGAVHWLEAGSYKRVQMYKGEPRNSALGRDGRMQLLCGRTQLNATIEQVAAFFDVSSTPKMRAFVATQDDVQDGVVLYTLVAPGPESDCLHQITVKWMAVRMPSGLAKDRDFVTLECQDTFTDSSGRRGWVRSYHSIKMPCCPDLQGSLGFVRGSMYHSGYVFVESDTPGVLTCLSSLQVDLKGNLVLPKALYDVGVKRRISALAHLQDKLHAKRLRDQQPPQLFLRDLDPENRDDSAWCTLCASGFSIFTRKNRCHACDAVVCHACTENLSLVLSANKSASKVRVCVPCATKRAKRGTESSNSVKRQRAIQLTTREGAFHTDPSSNLRRPMGNHRNRQGRSNTSVDTQGGVPRTHRRELQEDKLFVHLDGYGHSSQGSRFRHRSATSLHRREVRTTVWRDDNETLVLTEEPTDLSSDASTSSRGGQGTISFCDSLDGFYSRIESMPPRTRPAPHNVEDPAVSAVELYRGILALQRAQRVALSASTRRRLAEELGALRAKLDEATQIYELEH